MKVVVQVSWLIPAIEMAYQVAKSKVKKRLKPWVCFHVSSGKLNVWGTDGAALVRWDIPIECALGKEPIKINGPLSVASIVEAGVKVAPTNTGVLALNIEAVPRLLEFLRTPRLEPWVPWAERALLDMDSGYVLAAGDGWETFGDKEHCIVYPNTYCGGRVARKIRVRPFYMKQLLQFWGRMLRLEGGGAKSSNGEGPLLHLHGEEGPMYAKFFFDGAEVHYFMMPCLVGAPERERKCL